MTLLSLYSLIPRRAGEIHRRQKSGYTDSNPSTSTEAIDNNRLSQYCQQESKSRLGRWHISFVYSHLQWMRGSTSEGSLGYE
jgi:hypothetical protein